MMRTIKNLVGAGLISIAVFIFWVLILPDFDQRSFLQASVQSHTANLEKKTALIQKVDELTKQDQSKFIELKRLSLVVPSDKHLEELITTIQDIFLRSGIPLGGITLAVEDNSVLPYSTIGFEINLKTNYDSLVAFIETVEKSIRLIDFHQLNVSIDKESKGSNQILDVSFKANAYFVNQKYQPPTKENTPSPAVEQP